MNVGLHDVVFFDNYAVNGVKKRFGIYPVLALGHIKEAKPGLLSPVVLLWIYDYLYTEETSYPLPQHLYDQQKLLLLE